MFWLPEIGGVIARFSTRAEVALHNTRAECWTSAEPAQSGNGSNGGTGATRQDALDNRAFERQLDQLLDVVGGDRGGWLFVSRNELPPVFLGPEGFRFHARAMHHSEELIARYIQDLRAREEGLTALTKRLTLLIPEQSGEWFTNHELREKVLTRSETPGAAHVPDGPALRRMLGYFDKRWSASGSVRLVKAGEYEGKDLAEIGIEEARGLKGKTVSLTMLPDVWIAIAPELCERLRGAGGEGDRDETERAVVKWAVGISRKDKLYQSLLEDSLRNREILGVKVSAAEFNPRYRGQLLGATELGRAIRHWALAYHASRPHLSAPWPKSDPSVVH
jgi:hypothetical protein